MNFKVDLEDRVAIVTGGGRGIGREYALALAESGAAVVVADLDVNTASETAKLIANAGGRSLALEVDVSDQQSTLDMAAATKDAFGGAIDVLVNNAAMYHSIRKDPQLTVDIEYWRKVMAVNVDGALLCTQAVAPTMIEAGRGRVVIQASIGAYMGLGGHYCVSKLAVLGVMAGFAHELGPHGITCNAISPGVTFTEATLASSSVERQEQVVAAQPIAKRLMPEDMVGALLFLVSDASSYMTGQNILVDGGITQRV